MSLFALLLGIMFFLFKSGFSDKECPTITTFEDRRVNKNVLRIVQYNVEWLFIDYYKPMDCPGSGCTWHNTNDAKTHLDYVTNTIQYLDPDIINLCEVEGCDELNMVISNLSQPNIYKPYLKQGTDSATGQNVGLITKIDPLINLYRTEEKVEYPIQGTKCGNSTITGLEGVSKHYITKYLINNINIALIGAHLLAIPTEPNRCVQREAQAQVLQNVIYSYIQAGYEIIVIGDMNDYDYEVLDTNSHKPTSRTLDILKGLSGTNSGKYELTNVAYRIQQDYRYTDWYDSDNNCNTSTKSDLSMIDHILVTKNIDKKIKDVFIYHGYNEYCGKWDSDHWPVVLDLEI